MRVLIGDIFESDCRTLVNTVNCVGVMGKGVAREFKSRFPRMYADYRKRCERGEVEPGRPYLFEDLLGVSVLNFPTKDHWRSSSRLSFVSEGLDWLVAHWDDLGLTSVAFPPLGCGNGGLDWADVGPLMYSKLSTVPGDIEIYAPFGTPEEQLSVDFLASRELSSADKGGVLPRRFNKRWDIVLYVIDKLDKNEFAPWVGRTMYQKICYMLSRSGVDLGFAFRRGEFGPYSEDARSALTAFANNNKITETTVGPNGKMIRISVSPDFEFDNNLFRQSDLNVATSVIDFFSRVRSTDQAERYTTLLYCYDEIKKEEIAHQLNAAMSGSLCSAAIIERAIAWKPRWDTEAMRTTLLDELWALAMLKWVEIAETSLDVEELPF